MGTHRRFHPPPRKAGNSHSTGPMLLVGPILLTDSTQTILVTQVNISSHITRKRLLIGKPYPGTVHGTGERTIQADPRLANPNREGSTGTLKPWMPDPGHLEWWAHLKWTTSVFCCLLCGSMWMTRVRKGERSWVREMLFLRLFD